MSLGGRNSATDTGHSWSALPGSNPQASFPEHGLSKTDRKTTADPQPILVQAKENCDALSDGGLDASGTSTNEYVTAHQQNWHKSPNRFSYWWYNYDN